MKQWIYTFQREYKAREEILVGIFPPFPFLSYVQGKLKDFKNVFVGSQTISSFGHGNYTGEVTAETLNGIVSHTLIGHSERRKIFQELPDQLAQKTREALAHSIIPIYCVRDENDHIPEGVTFVAYEPIEAIGTGNNEAPSQVLERKKKLALPSDALFIYGGSVNEKNIGEYCAAGGIDGFLIGGASLDASLFVRIIHAVGH